jgi:hypothetical protein
VLVGRASGWDRIEPLDLRADVSICLRSFLLFSRDCLPLVDHLGPAFESRFAYNKARCGFAPPVPLLTPLRRRSNQACGAAAHPHIHVRGAASPHHRGKGKAVLAIRPKCPAYGLKLSQPTWLVDVSDCRKLLRCNVLVLHKAKGAPGDNPSRLHKLCGKYAAFHTGGRHFCDVCPLRHSSFSVPVRVTEFFKEA